MKKNTNSKILIFLTLSVLLSSCKKDFKIIDIHISKLPNDKVILTKQVEYLIENHIVNTNPKSETNQIESNKRRNFSRNERDLLEMQEDKRKKVFITEYIKKNKSRENDINILNKEAEVYFEKNSYEIFMEEIKREAEEFKKSKEGKEFARELDEDIEKMIEKEEAEKKEFISNIKSKDVNCIASIIILKNNIDENIEKLIITSIVKFEFSHKNFYYIRSSHLLSQNEIFKSGSKLEIESTDIIELSKGYDEKLFNNHSSKNITISYYISASNRIGYINNMMMSKIKTSQLGEFKDIKTINEKMFGEKIYTTDITNLFNK